MPNSTSPLQTRMIDEQKFHKTNSGHYPATFDFLGIKFLVIIPMSLLKDTLYLLFNYLFTTIQNYLAGTLIFRSTRDGGYAPAPYF